MTNWPRFCTNILVHLIFKALKSRYFSTWFYEFYVKCQMFEDKSAFVELFFFLYSSFCIKLPKSYRGMCRMDYIKPKHHTLSARSLSLFSIMSHSNHVSSGVTALQRWVGCHKSGRDGATGTFLRFSLLISLAIFFFLFFLQIMIWQFYKNVKSFF